MNRGCAPCPQGRPREPGAPGVPRGPSTAGPRPPTPQTSTRIPASASAAPAEPEHEQGLRTMPAGPASLGMARETAPIPVSAPLNVPMMPLAKSLSTALLELQGQAMPASAPVSAAGLADRKSTRLNLQSRLHLVCRLLLEKKNTSYID